MSLVRSNFPLTKRKPSKQPAIQVVALVKRFLMLISLPFAMNNSLSAHVGQKRKYEESTKTVIIDDDDDGNDRKEGFDDDEASATLLDADIQMGQQLILSLKQLSENNKRLKAENEKLKLDVQRIQRGLEALIYTKQDLLVNKSGLP
jgi:hypothetical protein